MDPGESNQPLLSHKTPREVQDFWNIPGRIPPSQASFLLRFWPQGGEIPRTDAATAARGFPSNRRTHTKHFNATKLQTHQDWHRPKPLLLVGGGFAWFSHPLPPWVRCRCLLFIAQVLVEGVTQRQGLQSLWKGHLLQGLVEASSQGEDPHGVVGRRGVTSRE